MRSFRCASAVSALLVLAVYAAQAENFWWDDDTGGSFHDPSNWAPLSPSGPPGELDRAAFDLWATSAYTVTFANAVTNLRLSVGTDLVDFNLGGFTYTLAAVDSFEIDAPTGATSVLTLMQGTLAVGEIAIGFQAGSTGRIRVDATGDLESRGAAWLAHDADTTAEIAVSGSGAEWSAEQRVSVGRQGEGSLSVADGGVVNVLLGDTFALIIGELAGSTGTVSVVDSLSELSVAGEIAVGQSGGATMTVDNGGTVSAGQALLASTAGSTGIVSVTRSALLETTTGGFLVGREGYGELDVSSNATLTVTAGLTVGEQPGGVGHATVSNGADATSDGVTLGGLDGAEGHLTVAGTASDFTSTRQAFIGLGGFGEVTVEAEGRLETQKAASPTGTSGIIGANATGVGYVLVTGVGSNWTQDGALNVGWMGEGTLEVQDVAIVDAVEAILGRIEGSHGTAIVTAATLNISGDMSLGGTSTASGGTGVLSVSDESGFVRIGHGPAGGTLVLWENGEINVNDGRVVVGGEVFYGPGSLYVMPAGVVDLRGGSVSATIAYVEGLLSGTGTVASNVNLSGNLEPGASPGTIEIDGNLVLSADATCVFDVEGLSLGQYDLVRGIGTGNTVSFDGTLELAFSGDFTEGDAFQIFEFDGYAGDFADLLVTGLDPAQDAKFIASSGTVIVIPEPGMLGLFGVAAMLALGKRGRAGSV